VVIPPFDPATGNLPPGVHEATWDEIVARYGYTPHHLALLAGLKAALDSLRAAGCRRACCENSRRESGGSGSKRLLPPFSCLGGAAPA
jgi:uncharacterized protein DUF6932